MPFKIFNKSTVQRGRGQPTDFFGFFSSPIKFSYSSFITEHTVTEYLSESWAKNTSISIPKITSQITFFVCITEITTALNRDNRFAVQMALLV